MLIYWGLYPSWYKSRLYPSWYKRDEGGNNELLVTVWLEEKDDLKSITESRDRWTQSWNHMTMALQMKTKIIMIIIKTIASNYQMRNIAILYF